MRDTNRPTNPTPPLARYIAGDGREPAIQIKIYDDWERGTWIPCRDCRTLTELGHWLKHMDRKTWCTQDHLVAISEAVLESWGY